MRLLAPAVCFGAVVCLLLEACQGQQLPWKEDGHPYRRIVVLAGADSPPDIVVCEFYTHGQLAADGSNLAVWDRRGVVAFRVLQAGPGDFCRVAFRTREKESQYAIYYGGPSDAPPSRSPPARDAAGKWEHDVGLLLETRAWKECDLDSVESVRRAFQSSQRIGSSYVDQVFHRHDPFNPTAEPLLSRYHGTLVAPLSGKYAFFTSSQDCSFLLVDGRVVVSAPGRHGPVGQARFRGDVTLAAGPHDFEYLHAATGDETCMVAAWQLPGFDKPSLISPEVFGADRLARLTAGELQQQQEGFLPDFQWRVTGDVPLADSPQPLVQVAFANRTSSTVRLNARFDWQFGDGQTGSEIDPVHVFLHPGLYDVSLRLRRGMRTLVTTHRIVIPQRPEPAPSGQQPHTLSDYLPALETYQPQSLDPQGLLQLVRVRLQQGEPRKAVEAGRFALTPEATRHDDQSRWELVSMLAPLLRDELADPEESRELWRKTGQLLKRRDWRARCALESADISLSDLLRPADAKPMLDYAAERLDPADAASQGKLNRLWGDWYARAGDAAAAQSSYAAAAAAQPPGVTFVEQNARRGARARSAEAFLRAGELQRAWQELQRWQAEFPLDKMDGYLSLLLARYWMARRNHANAIAVTHDLLTVNARSPYADQLLAVAAECEQLQGNWDRARANYESLLQDYPGSPLVDSARKQLASLLEKHPSTETDSDPKKKP